MSRPDQISNNSRLNKRAKLTPDRMAQIDANSLAGFITLKRFEYQLYSNEVASIGGIPKKTLGRIERGEVFQPRLATLVGIALGFGWRSSDEEVKRLCELAGLEATLLQQRLEKRNNLSNPTVYDDLLIQARRLQSEIDQHQESLFRAIGQAETRFRLLSDTKE